METFVLLTTGLLKLSIALFVLVLTIILSIYLVESIIETINYKDPFEVFENANMCSRRRLSSLDDERSNQG